MSKQEADNLKKIEISWLKKQGYLNGYSRGDTITWSNRWSGDQSSIGIYVSTLEDGQGYMKLSYTQTDSDGSKKDFDYTVFLTTTSCNYGGHRFWFVCPLSVKGVACKRRVGVVYKRGDYFGCRYCHDLTYESRNLGGIYKQTGTTVSYPELDRLKADVKRPIYNGKMTRKYLRYTMKKHKSDMQLLNVAAALDKRFKPKKK